VQAVADRSWGNVYISLSVMEELYARNTFDKFQFHIGIAAMCNHLSLYVAATATVTAVW